ncbi:MAG TPA: glycosyl hydrolase [Verrucomicrobiae bacterium]|nr:glycosyl hydrolase [Verrucomicrobiae bacterium]
MKKICCLLPAMIALSGCCPPQPPANPYANVQTKAVLKYFQGLEARSDKRLLSGQFSNFGDRANLRLLNDIHANTGHWPAIIGADYAGRGGINAEAADQAAIAYWRQGGLVTISAHMLRPHIDQHRVRRLARQGR